MSLAELTSRAAVLEAIHEFDRIGREAFLRRYGFGEARDYFLRHDERLYDSKAIAGAAFGYQHAGRGPLKSADFSGGDATVRARLEALGFEVVQLKAAPQPGADQEPVDQKELEKAFHRAMIEIYKEAKDLGYTASRFLRMVNEHGGVETAKLLLHSNAVSEGYVALYERQRLDLTVEALVLQPAWIPLFTDAERAIAKKRLTEYGYGQAGLP